MRTLEAATELLHHAATRAGLAQLARAIGFDAPLPLAREALTALGIESVVRDARIARGPGCRRALLVNGSHDTPVRELTAVIAARLSRAAPQLLWLLLVQQRGSSDVVLATWTPDRARPRVSALVVDSSHVHPSDAEAVRALRDAGSELDLLAHARWLAILGRESLTRRFYRTLERLVGELAASGTGHATEAQRSELALLCVSRLLFLSFLQSKGWLDGDHDFLARTFTGCMTAGGGYHQRVLLPLFFGTLNTPLRRRAPAARRLGRVPFLNGGLFSRTSTEQRCRQVTFGDDTLGALFGELLLRYRFSAREESDSWTETAIDPEMLGRVFESLMASRDRRSSGSFYTPQPLVASVTRTALIEALAPRPSAIPDIERFVDGMDAPPGTAHALLKRLRGLTLLDPACGSGAFLVHALETIALLARRLGDDRPVDAIRRSVLASSIFGVDVNPTAAWLCELRLWLSVVIESTETDPLAAPTLPNLDHHIRVGDALAGDAFANSSPVAGASAIARLRDRYVRATGKRKVALARELERRERSVALARVDDALEWCAHRRRDLLAKVRSPDLFGERHAPLVGERDALDRERLRARELRAERRALAGGGPLPFAFATRYPDVASRGGFDVVLGNPPWVRLRRIPSAVRARLRQRFEVLAHPTWEKGAAAAGATGFASQPDLAALFLERSLALLREDGVFALLLPSKLWRSLAGGGARRLLATSARVTRVEDWSEAPALFDAAAYPSLVAGRKCTTASERSDGALLPLGRRERASSGSTRGTGRVPVHHTSPHAGRQIAASYHCGEEVHRWEMSMEALLLERDTESPWLLAPPKVRAAFDLVRGAGPPLANSSLGRPQLGVKCGCNEAFLVTLLATHGRLATVRSNGFVFHVERELLRPLVRGEGVGAWRLADGCERIIWTHGTDGRPLAIVPPKAFSWLRRWRPRLRDRSDGRNGAWWSLFRTAAADDASPRVIWSDFGRRPRAAVIAAGDRTVPLNSCYVVKCPSMADAVTLATLLNSPLAAAWLRLLAEPARGGYCRYLAWTVALLPLPQRWDRAVRTLAPIGSRAHDGEPASEVEILSTILDAYGVERHEIEPLISWSAR